MARILIIDDDPGFRFVLRHTLSTLGHTVHEAIDGKEALPWIESGTIDIAVIDIVMPDMDGFELLRKFRRESAGRPAPMKVIVMSGGTMIGKANYLRMAELLGANRTLAKPFPPETLIAVINELESPSEPAAILP